MIRAPQKRLTATLSRHGLIAVVGILILACSKNDGRRGGSGPLPSLHLSDVTAQSGIDFAVTSGRTPSTQILEVKGGGLALFDIDGDGDLDLFVPNGATLDSPYAGPGSHTFENQGGLHFEDVTGRKGPSFDRWGFGTTVGDVNGDGHDDLYIACYGSNALYAGDGVGGFDDVTEVAGVGGGDRWSAAATFGDIDQDGDLDLYIANVLDFDTERPPSRTTFLNVDVFGGPHGMSPTADVLLENQGDGTFRDITESSGCGAVSPSYGLGVVIADFDNDATPEIFVGNDSGKNFLFCRKPDGTFEDRGVISGIASNQDGVDQATMGIALGDVNGDLLPDVFTTNFMNDTNTLHVNLGTLLFDDQTTRYGLGVVSRPYLAWATSFVDFDHDGDEDLIVFDGHVYPKETTDPVGWKHDQTPQLYVRDGSRFELSNASAGAWLEEAHCDRSAVFGDLDDDGDIDVIVGELNGPIRVLENDGATGPWLIVELADRREGIGNRRGLGARVVVKRDEKTLTRWIHGGGSYQAANPPYAHFGLATEEPVEVEVIWPDGHRTRQADVATRRRITIARD